MGMNKANEIYGKVAEAWRLPGSSSFIKILETAFTPEEGKLVLELNTPMTCEELAEKLDMSKEDVQRKLDSLTGWVLRVEGKYINMPNMIGVMPSKSRPDIPREKVMELWSEFWRSGEYPMWLLDTWVRMYSIVGHAIHRILPVRRALAASPKILPEQILWYEDMPEMFRRAQKITIGNCGCRSVWGTCDYPMETCISVSYQAVGNVPDPRKVITADEAIAICEKCEDKGMLNIPPNQAEAILFCNCCPCCCEVAHPYIEYGDTLTRKANLAPSRYRATVDQDQCIGCQNCLERCHFGAIEMMKTPNSKKLKASVNSDVCMGCGLCVLTCEPKALTMELVRPPEHIPTGGTPADRKKRLSVPNWLTA
jgi:Pyruvate/2-oxoacid:ferredoxin oxidoreductase delta subunit